MKTNAVPVSVLDIIDMLISGREKLAAELMEELRESEKQTLGGKMVRK